MTATACTANSCKYWVLVASRDHVLSNGKTLGIAQFCYGRLGPCKRLHKGDYVIYYSSKMTFEGKEPCQRFTAIGEIVNDKPYQVELSPDFKPFRRDMRYLPSREVDVRPLVPSLEFIKNKKQWGGAFRFGFLEIPKADFELLRSKMVLEEKEQEPVTVAADNNNNDDSIVEKKQRLL